MFYSKLKLWSCQGRYLKCCEGGKTGLIEARASHYINVLCCRRWKREMARRRGELIIYRVMESYCHGDGGGGGEAP